ncbi:hypothetical protein ACHHYP_07415 [Achlya hypogyna]|uniref:Secreted protein n=1 Tax=Achlya hypogyna TaxID=1202772 RepID=A0A1V9ZMN8_ACHHY|nr:hypothetical protein ACHHYP_07415 [Achlya hypogyna]
MQISVVFLVLFALLVDLTAAFGRTNTTAALNHIAEDTTCAAIDEVMAPVCGDRALQWEHKCEKQCVDAVAQLLRQPTKQVCLVEWKVVAHLQATQCADDHPMLFGLRSMSVTTIASAILSVFLLFSCTS